VDSVYNGKDETNVARANATISNRAKKNIYLDLSGPPDNPDLRISSGTIGRNVYRKGEKLEVSCSAPSGRPAANVSLFLG